MIFIDCEFTSIESPELLSVGLVADNGRELYVELTGESHLIGASAFVLDTVVPQFGLMPHAVATMEELGRRVGEWLLEFFEQPIDVAYDYHTDFDLLERALQSAGLWERLKDIIRPTHIGYLIGQDAVEASMEMSWAASRIADGIDRHHALADARALLAGFLAMHGEQTKPAGFGAAIDLLADAEQSAADHSAASIDDAISFFDESNLRIASLGNAPKSHAWQVVEVQVIAELSLQIRFADGVHGTVQFQPAHLTGVFEVLKDPDFFREVRVEFGAVTWPGELDLATDVMYDEIKAHGEWVLR